MHEMQFYSQVQEHDYGLGLFLSPFFANELPCIEGLFSFCIADNESESSKENQKGGTADRDR